MKEVFSIKMLRSLKFSIFLNGTYILFNVDKKYVTRQASFIVSKKINEFGDVKVSK